MLPSPLGGGFGQSLTEDLRKSLIKEMDEAEKSLSAAISRQTSYKRFDQQLKLPIIPEANDSDAFQ